jgi:FixJ family two-component response regulator
MAKNGSTFKENYAISGDRHGLDLVITVVAVPSLVARRAFRVCFLYIPVMQTITQCMLIDDDLEEHDLFRMALGDLALPTKCLSFLTYKDATTFLGDSAGFRSDFIFVDWTLSDDDGYHFISYLQQTTNLKTSKIFIYSGTHQQKLVVQYLKDRNINFLSKQESVYQLTKELERILRQID